MSASGKLFHHKICFALWYFTYTSNYVITFYINAVSSPPHCMITSSIVRMCLNSVKISLWDISRVYSKSKSGSIFKD